MLLPLQGVLLFSIRTPKALPWAMCFWGFQPVLFDFWHTLCTVVLERSPFGLQNESFWWAKGVLLKGKRTTIGRQKESFLNFEFWVLNFELFSATPAILNYSILNWCRWQFWILRIVCQTAIIWKGYLCHPKRKKPAEGTCPSTGFALLNVSERLLTIS